VADPAPFRTQGNRWWGWGALFSLELGPPPSGDPLDPVAEAQRSLELFEAAAAADPALEPLRSIWEDLAAYSGRPQYHPVGSAELASLAELRRWVHAHPQWTTPGQLWYLIWTPEQRYLTVRLLGLLGLLGMDVALRPRH
jgi:hypothetical protein